MHPMARLDESSFEVPGRGDGRFARTERWSGVAFGARTAERTLELLKLEIVMPEHCRTPTRWCERPYG